MCGEIKIKRKRILCDDKWTAAEPIGYVGDDDLPPFLSKLLDQFQEEKLLTWHGNGIRDDKIRIKLGGDHGGGTLEFMLQIANVRGKFKIKYISLYRGRLQRLVRQLCKKKL